MSRYFIALLVVIAASRATPGAEPAKAADADHALFKTAAALFDDVKTKTLANGLTIYLKPIPGSPIVTTMVAYKVGACDEDLDQTGLSHYLEHLMFKGTDKLAPGDIDRRTQRNGGRNNAYTTEDMTVYHFDFAADRWLTALEIEADRMRNTRVDAKHEFQQEKGAVISELNRNEDRPWDLEQKAILPLLFGAKSPYGHPVIGERQHVEGATAEIITRHYDRWYHPNNAALVIVGGFDEKEALAAIDKLFSAIPKAELPPRKPVVASPERKETVRHKMPSKFEMPRLLMGFNTVPAGAEDSYALDVLQTVLGSGRTSRLYRKLIDEDKLASSVSASHSSGRYPGWFSINVELVKNDLDKVEKTVMDEIARIAMDGITEAELKRVKRGMVASYIFSNESIHSICDSIAQSVTANDLDYLKSYLPRLDKVTAADVKRVAQKFMVDAKGVVVWSVPQPANKEKSAIPAGRNDTTPRPARSGRAAADGGAEAFQLSAAKTVTLPNGLKLLLLENHRLPLVVAEAKVKQVRLREPAEKNGVTALMGNLMEEGTATRKGEEIARLIEDTGGSLSVGASDGKIKVLSPDIELGFDLLLDCLMNPSFPADAFDAKRDELLSLIAEEERTPGDLASREFAAGVYGKHPYGRSALGKAEIVKKLTRQDCLDFHAALFRPDNVVMAVVGDFDSEKLVKLITKLTANWKPAALPALPDYPIEMPAKFTQKIISDPEAQQVHVYLGHRGIKRDNPDYYKLLVMDNVLGTGPGFTDRLSANLRDRQGLAYTVSGQIAASAGKEPGTFTGYIGTFPKDFIWVRDSFLKEIRKIRDEPPTKQEVDDAVKYLTGSLPFRIITSEQVASLLLSIDEYHLGLNYLDDYRKAVSAVTPEEVQAVAKKYLDPDRIFLVAVGAIDADGKPLGKKK
jgi:zinc protease